MIAQRQYRQRHANKFKHLQEENARLRRAINSIVSASNKADLSVALKGAIAEAAQVVAIRFANLT